MLPSGPLPLRGDIGASGLSEAVSAVIVASRPGRIRMGTQARAAHLARRADHLGGVGEFEGGVEPYPLLERDPQLHAGQLRTDAAVDAETEGGVADLRPIDPDLVGVGENSGSRFAAGMAGAASHPP